ncbi:MAG: Cdc6/Cdc18 family protein, partial [Candidatus Hodarchaeales archaeon]
MTQKIKYESMEIARGEKLTTSIDDQLKIIEEIIEMDSVFKDETKFSLDYVPEYLPHRIEVLKSLTLLMRGCTGQDGSKFNQNAIIIGPVGSGKTAVIKHYCRLIEELNKKRDKEDTFIYIHVNVLKLKTPYVIITNIIKSLIPYFPRRGYSTPELICILFETLKKKRAHVLICLDEIDSLEGSADQKSSFLYSLTNQETGLFQEDNDQVISLLLLSSNERFMEQFDESTRNSIMKNIIHLPPYTTRELEDILIQRAEKGLVDNVICPTVINMIAKITESTGGNAHYGIELLWKAAKHADKYKRKRISYEDVRATVSSAVSGYINQKILETMDFNQKILLLAITNIFSENVTTTPATLFKIRTEYRKTCKLFRVKPRKKTQLWVYLSNFKKQGIIEVQMVNEGVNGRQSYIELLGIPANIL